MQVAKVERTLAAKSPGFESEQKSCSIMALLDDGTLRRHKSWLKVDFMFNSSKEVSSLKRLLTMYSSINNRQTILASASVPQHRRFLYDCMQKKWTKADAVHVHVNTVAPMPSCLYHRFVICGKRERQSTSLHLLQSDSPQSAIIFVGEQDVKQAEGYLLVATDITGRGVDLPETTHIYNFDLPKDAVSYFHWAGQTGRKPFSMRKALLPALLQK